MKRVSLGWIVPLSFGLLAACADYPTAPIAQSAPAAQQQPAADLIPDHDWGFGFDEDLFKPDLRAIAQFKSKPAPPDPLHDHASIGPEGGSLRVGDFEIIVPAGAVERKTNFSIKIPVDPRASEHAYAEFLPHMIFRKPVKIRLPRASTESSAGADVLWWAGILWVPLRTHDLSDGRIEADVWHFSFYGTSCTKGITTLGG